MNGNAGHEAESMQTREPCLVKVQLFEGPLDLLLHLIKKNEVDIYDIPIAVITEQYIQYLEFMKDLDLQVVGNGAPLIDFAVGLREHGPRCVAVLGPPGLEFLE